MKTIDARTGRVIKAERRPTPGGKAARRLLRKASLVSGFKRRKMVNGESSAFDFSARGKAP